MKSPLSYQAKDSIVLEVGNEVLTLYQGAELQYDKIKLKADSIAVDYGNSTLYADGKVDSTGQYSGRPTFEDGEQTYTTTKIAYNYKTKKGRVDGARTKQGEAVIIGTSLRKEDDSTYYIKDGRFTTCDLEHPHFYIQSKKLKVIPRDKIISGPLRLVIEGFPMPLPVPFGFFPNQQGRRSGVLLPVYGESVERGYFLRKGGYYLAISDNLDLTLRGDIFSKGGWGLDISSNYEKRYRYTGFVGFEYGFQKFGEKTDPEYRVNKNFFVRWNHDQKISPSTTLRAMVNAGSTNFLQNVSYSDQDYLTNTLRSNVTFTKSFSPYNLTVNLDHNQNTSTRVVNFTLPNIALTKSRAFPFRSRKGVSTGAFYEKIGYSYNFNFKNDITLPDSLVDDFFLRPGKDLRVTTVDDEARDDADYYRPWDDYYRNGMRHTIPVTTQFSMLKYVNFTPSFNYNEYWYFRTIERVWENGAIVQRDVNGFATARDFNFAVTANTRLYGIFGIGGKRQTKIRHTLIPSVGYNLRPDFSKEKWGYYETVQVGDTGNQTQIYSRFQDGIFGGPSRGEQQTINFGLGNLLEMKWLKRERENPQALPGMKPRKGADDLDTSSVKKDPFTRFNLIDNLAIGGSYNFAADSFQLSPLGMQMRVAPLGNLLNIQANAILDPYKVNSVTGRSMDTLVWQEGEIGRISSMNVTLSSTLSSKRRGAVKENPQVTPAEWAHIAYYRNQYVDFNVPWNLNMSYNLNYTNSGLEKNLVQTLNFSGDFNFTPKWKFQATSGFDFVNKDFTYTTLTIYRDLHCWEMSLRWIPFGNRRSYIFSLNVKSAALRDLKLNKRNDWQDRF